MKVAIVLPLLALSVGALGCMSGQEDSGASSETSGTSNEQLVPVERLALRGLQEELKQGPVPVARLLKGALAILAATEVTGPGREPGSFEASISVVGSEEAASAKLEKRKATVTVVSPSEGETTELSRILLEFPFNPLPSDVAFDPTVSTIGTVLLAFMDDSVQMAALMGQNEFEWTPELAKKVAGPAGLQTGGGCRWEPGALTWTPLFLSVSYSAFDTSRKWHPKPGTPTTLEAPERLEGDVRLLEKNVVAELQRIKKAAMKIPVKDE